MYVQFVSMYAEVADVWLWSFQPQPQHNKIRITMWHIYNIVQHLRRVDAHLNHDYNLNIMASDGVG